jgi:hypothetical protein
MTPVGSGPNTSTPPEPAAIPLQDYGTDYRVTTGRKGQCQVILVSPTAQALWRSLPTAMLLREQVLFHFLRVRVYPSKTKAKVRVEVKTQANNNTTTTVSGTVCESNGAVRVESYRSVHSTTRYVVVEPSFEQISVSIRLRQNWNVYLAKKVQSHSFFSSVTASSAVSSQLPSS